MSGHIILIGLSGSGKSTTGRRLADQLARPFYDTDTLLAQHAGQPVPELLRADPLQFRALEEEVVAGLASLPRGVVATGGGVVLSERNRAALRDGNWVIWLRAPIATLAMRVACGEDRPLLAGDPVARLSALSRERAPLYTACAHDIVESADAPRAIVLQRLAASVRRWESANEP